MKKIILIIALSLLYSIVYSQDTIKVMTYNLLNYGFYPNYCTTSNNNVSNKNEYLKTIIDYTLPDILGVVEIAPDDTYIDGFRANVLNQNGRDYYAKTPKSNYSGSPIINMLYYDSRKMTLSFWVSLATTYRDINIYTFYFENDALENGDTVYLTCIVMHLKAGNTDTDASDRTAMAQTLMNFLNNFNENTNYLVMGDFNVYSSSEGAYQQLTNHPNANIRFYDFINKSGDWSNDQYFSLYHSQSTHSTSDCFSGGGLDDRFDFILGNINTITGAKGFKYLANSYTTLGQDGLHFNKDLLDDPTNTTVPSNVLNALHGNSDHLPIISKFIVDNTLSINDYSLPINYYMIDNKLYINFINPSNADISIKILDIQGRNVFTDQIPSNMQQYVLDMNNYNKGVYLIDLFNNTGFTSIKVLNF
ncbi:MAG: T9SS type A sorting domain-containing protein [Bacteroidales bacterium]|nr:T9SS type A sorting domain-containing protein [Bacteroidales bacterium]